MVQLLQLFENTNMSETDVGMCLQVIVKPNSKLLSHMYIFSLSLYENEKSGNGLFWPIVHLSRSDFFLHICLRIRTYIIYIRINKYVYLSENWQYKNIHNKNRFFNNIKNYKKKVKKKFNRHYIALYRHIIRFW